jgi:hypothetical protein
MSASAPDCTVSLLTPSFSSVPSTTNLPAKMPIEPVSVVGAAQISSAPTAIQ